MNRLRSISLMLALSGALYHAAIAAQLPAKHWVGTATSHGHAIPIHLDLSVSTTGEVTGDFVNGPQLTPSSNGQLTGTHLVLNFSYFARKLEGDFTGDSFKGTFGGSRGEPSTLELHPVLAAAGAPKPTPDAGIKQVRGDWEIAVKSPKGESAWTLRVTPLAGGDQIKAVILRIDGDTNGLYGAFDAEHGEYRVSHFNASGPAAFALKPQPDGTLLVTNLLRDDQQWTARRPEEARKENLAPPTRETEQTSVVDTTQPFQFSAPDLSGRTVSNTDPEFRNKVVIVAVGGSWCPNCHDEAPFLVELYKRYHSRGLEIVNISFEEEDQLKTRSGCTPSSITIRFPTPYCSEAHPTTCMPRSRRVKTSTAGPPVSSSGAMGW